MILQQFYNFMKKNCKTEQITLRIEKYQERQIIDLTDYTATKNLKQRKLIPKTLHKLKLLQVLKKIQMN